MPKKSIREMNERERKYYSLSAKTFNGVLNLSIVLTVISVILASVLFAIGARKQYNERCDSISQTITTFLKGEDVEKYTGQVMEIYNGLSADKKTAQDSESYDAAFEGVRDKKFDEIAGFLHTLCEKNGAASIYIGVPDSSENNFVFVINSNPDEDFRKPGRSIKLEKKYIDAFKKNLNVLTSAVFSKTEDGNYVCTGSDTLETEDGRVVGYLVVNMYLSDVVKSSRSFFLRYVLIMLAVTIIVDLLAVKRNKKMVVDPLNSLSGAAEKYIEDRKNGELSRHHFSELNIRTGDEIENLQLIMSDMEVDMENYISELQTVTAEKERIGAELGIASQIQESMLPHIFPAFPERSEFDVYATMDPAKEVGGDFYDYFLIDNNHLGIVIADVSGKGVSAALFMMASKILINNMTRMSPVSPARILEKVNSEICENNEADMFVTVWLGILDITTGVVRASNAGHEYPAICRKDGSYELFKDPHGFVIGGMADMEYKDYDFKLEKGDRLFLYTDGVPEATNASSELFGTGRMLSSLNKAKHEDSKSLLHSVKKDIDEFVGKAPQFDDITMVSVEYFGK